MTQGTPTACQTLCYAIRRKEEELTQLKALEKEFRKLSYDGRLSTEDAERAMLNLIFAYDHPAPRYR